MKNILHRTLLLITSLVSTTSLLVSCSSNDDAQQFLSKLDREAEARKQEILSTPTILDQEKLNTIYYISSEGNDQNDGLTPETAILSLEHLNSLDLQPGDGVMFRRGDLWRGQLKAKRGVTYSAYGKGEKPRIYGSPYDAAKVGKWVETETRNVYMYDGELPNDIGTLVFNHGQAHAFKVMMIREEDGSTLHIETREPFASYRDLKRDLEFYHDYRDEKRIYLCSTEGNPAERFSSIELLTKGHIVLAASGATFDNLCLKYCGSHGIGSGTTKDLTVTNCELGWIGGSIQSESAFGRNHPTRYGNAVEIYGGCENFMVSNCYIYQIYDAAVTHQHQGDVQEPLIMRNVTYSNNRSRIASTRLSISSAARIPSSRIRWRRFSLQTTSCAVQATAGVSSVPTRRHLPISSRGATTPTMQQTSLWLTTSSTAARATCSTLLQPRANRCPRSQTTPTSSIVVQAPDHGVARA